MSLAPTTPPACPVCGRQAVKRTCSRQCSARLAGRASAAARDRAAMVALGTDDPGLLAFARSLNRKRLRAEAKLRAAERKKQYRTA